MYLRPLYVYIGLSINKIDDPTWNYISYLLDTLAYSMPRIYDRKLYLLKKQMSYYYMYRYNKGEYICL